MLRRLGFAASLSVAAGVFFAPAALGDTAVGKAPEQLSACINRNHAVSIAVLMDESTSLQGSDPRGLRVPALKGLIYALSDLGRAGSGGKPTEVEIRLIGFDGHSHPDFGWVGLSSTSGRDQLVSQAAEFVNRNHGVGTNYRAALDQANKSLRSRLKDKGSRCMAVVIFTDGEFWITPSGKPTAHDRHQENLALSAMCGRHGLVQSLYDADILRFAIALGGNSKLDTGGRKFDLLTALAVGGAGADGFPSCGSAVPRVGLLQTGYFTDAKDPSLLYARLGQLLLDPKASAKVGPRDFQVYRGINRLVLDIGLGHRNQRVEVEGPHPVVSDGATKPVSFSCSEDAENKNSTISQWGAKLVVNCFDTRMRIEAEFDSQGGKSTGRWHLGYSDSPAGSSTIRMYAALNIDPKTTTENDLVGVPKSFRIGSTNRFRFRLVDHAGRPAPSELIALAAPSAYYTISNGESVKATISMPDERGIFSGVVPVPASWSESNGHFDIRSGFNPPEQIVIQPIWQPFEVVAKFSKGAGFPEVYPLNLDFGSIEGKGARTQSFKVVGDSGSKRSGCIWIGEIPSSPGGISPPIISPRIPSDPNNCMNVGPGQTLTFKVSIGATANDVDRTLRLGLPLHMRTRMPVDGLPERTPNLVIDAQFVPEQSVARTIGLEILCLFVGLGLPLLLLYLLNRRGALFRRVESLRYLELPVYVDSTDTTRRLVTADSEALTYPEDDADLPKLYGSRSSANVRLINASGFSFFTAAFRPRDWRLLFTGPAGFVKAGGAGVAAGAIAGARAPELGVESRVKLDLHDSWVFERAAVRSSGSDSSTSENSAHNGDEGWFGEQVASSNTAARPVELQGRLMLIIKRFSGREKGEALLANALLALPALLEQAPLETATTDIKSPEQRHDFKDSKAEPDDRKDRGNVPTAEDEVPPTATDTDFW